MLLALAIACQEPFDADRHDLVGSRVAAVELGVDAAGWRPRVAVVTEGRPFTDERPELRWFWLRDADELAAIDDEAVPDGEGPQPVLPPPAGAGALGLWARFPDGTEQRSFLEPPTHLEPVASSFDPVGQQTVTTPSVGDVLSLDARRALAATDGAGGADDLMRLSLTARRQGSPTTDLELRWMATAGTFLELDGQTTDWFPGELTLDDGEVEAISPGDEGVHTLVVLAIGEGLPAFTAAELVVGDAGEGTFVGGRWLPGLSLLQPGWVRLVADDAAPSGLRSEAVTVDEVGPLPCDAPGGGGNQGTFDLDVLLDLRCTRAELDGAIAYVVPDGGSP